MSNNNHPISPQLNLQDIIEERLTKMHAISSCLLAAWDSQIQLDQDTIYNTIWSIHDYLQEIMQSRAALTEKEIKS